MTDTIKIASITRTNKGKGITVTLVNGDKTVTYEMRKTGGEKYTKISLWQFSPELWKCWTGKDEPCDFPVAVKVHKPNTNVDGRRGIGYGWKPTLLEVADF